MSMLPSVFKPSEVKDDLLPDGLYLFEIIKSDMKDTKAGTGKYLSLTMKVVDAEDIDNVGSVVFVNLNLVNPNQIAVGIAQIEFKNLCDALGLESVEDSQELHGIPFCGKIGIREGKDSFPDSNHFKSYLNENEFTNGSASKGK